MAKIFFRYRPPPGILGGEVVPRDVPPSNADSVPAVPEEPGSNWHKPDRWWHQSSWDLLHGLDVQEDAQDTVPGELLDELFKPRR
jgi:hypothetical protein